MIKGYIYDLITNAEQDLLNEDNKDLKKSKDFVKEWLESPSCPLVDDDEVKE